MLKSIVKKIQELDKLLNQFNKNPTEQNKKMMEDKRQELYMVLKTEV